jgi:growth factor-regulated tyrosine kinase substrate
MEDLRDMARITSNETLRNKIIELIQVWAHAFRNEPSYKAVQDTLNVMKAEGFKFPYLRESDAMFAADAAPSWADGDNCHRCRVAFGLIQRQHHCRCCGQVFCDKCSSKSCPIPKFGIEKDVRVCDDCYEKLNRTSVLIPKSATTEEHKTKPGSTKATAPTGKTEAELREEEELQMAIALSQSEAEAKEQTKRRSSSLSTTSTTKTSSIKTSSNGHAAKAEQKEDPELSRYLDREYWEQKQWEQQQQKRRSSSPAPSAPSQVISTSKAVTATAVQQDLENLTLTAAGSDEKNHELDGFVSQLHKALEMFVNRMNSNKVRGRPIANDSSVQSLFLNITNMHSQLIKHLQDEEDKRVHFEGLQDKLNEIRDARAALDSLREEHREQKRREAEEQEAMRQKQMAHKLDIMRKQKQEYLQYQRQVALQRIQEQEREMQLRKEQQKYGVQQNPQQPAWTQQSQYPPSSYGHYVPQPAVTPPAHPYGHYIPPADQHAQYGRHPPAYSQMMPPGSTAQPISPHPGQLPPHAVQGYPPQQQQQPVYPMQQQQPQQVQQPMVKPPENQGVSPPTTQPEEPLITFD